ncbi:hypothetical protein [Helicobacter sp. 23-1045]
MSVVSCFMEKCEVLGWNKGIIGYIFWLMSPSLSKSKTWMPLCTYDISKGVPSPITEEEARFLIKKKIKRFDEFKQDTMCPSCKKTFCIEHTDKEIVSDFITSSNTDTVVEGNMMVHWRCKECGESGSGKVKYKIDEFSRDNLGIDIEQMLRGGKQ